MFRDMTKWVLALFLACPVWVMADSQASSLQWKQYADRQYQARQYDAAIGSYKNALTYDRRNAAAYQGMGNCYLAKGDKSTALTYYKYSLQVNPDNSALRTYVASLSGSGAAPGGAAQRDFEYGNQYLARKNYADAVGWYRQSLQVDPNNAKVYQAMGNAYYYQGNKDQALASWDKAVALDPSNTSLKAYADSIRGASAPQQEEAAAPAASSAPASSTGGQAPASVSAGGGYTPYVLGGLVVGLGALMIAFF